MYTNWRDIDEEAERNDCLALVYDADADAGDQQQWKWGSRNCNVKYAILIEYEPGLYVWFVLCVVMAVGVVEWLYGFDPFRGRSWDFSRFSCNFCRLLLDNQLHGLVRFEIYGNMANFYRLVRVSAWLWNLEFCTKMGIQKSRYHFLRVWRHKKRFAVISTCFFALFDRFSHFWHASCQFCDQPEIH